VAILAVSSCSTDEDCPNRNFIKGKLKSMTFEEINQTYLYEYDSVMGKLLKITRGDSIVMIRISHINDQLVLLESSLIGNYEVTISQNKVIDILPVSPEVNFNSMGFFDWDINYDDSNAPCDIQINFDFTTPIPFSEHYTSGKLSDFEYNGSYLSSMYSYELDGNMQQDTFEFEYSNFEYDYQLPFQDPYFHFSYFDVAHTQFINYPQVLYVLRLSGYDSFLENQHLLASSNNVEYTYTFNSNGQVINLKVENVEGFGGMAEFSFSYYD
jgi:hypothetical protein